MKTYEVETMAKTELVQAASVDESDPHVVRFVPAQGRPRSFGRGTLVRYKEVVIKPADDSIAAATMKGLVGS